MTTGKTRNLYTFQTIEETSSLLKTRPNDRETILLETLQPAEKKTYHAA